jgi:phage shock protein E
MKFPPLVFALFALCATSLLAQKTETQKSEAKKPAAPAAPAAPADAPKAPAPPADKVKDVTPDEVEKLVRGNKEIVVLDVRTPEEFEMGHIAGATNMSFLDLDFEKNVQQLAGKTIVVHCAAGNRSAKAVNLLKDKAFPMIYHMSGGYHAWVGAGKPVVASPKPPK